MRRYFSIFALVFVATSWSTWADTLITATFGSSFAPSVTAGYAFILNHDIMVSAVAVYDTGDNGLASTNRLGIWSAGGALLASKVFDSTTSPSLAAHFRWLPLDTPLVLAANTAFRIGTFGSEGGIQGTASPGSLSPEIRFIAEVSSVNGDSLTFPNSGTNNTSGMAYLGPNLQYILVPTLQAARGAVGHLKLSWPTNATGFALESAPALPAVTWSAVTNTPVVASNLFTADLVPSQTQKVFRLRHP
jgi:hypothetical protein